MSFIEDLRTTYPELSAATDEQLISILPDIEPEKFGGLTPEQVTYAATTNDSQLTKGFKAGIDQTQAIGGGLLGLLGDAAGARDLKKFGVEAYNDNTQEAQQYRGNVDGFTDIKGVEDAFDWATYSLGNLAPTMATALASGGIGGVAARYGGKQLVSNIIAKEVARGVTKEEAVKIAGNALAKRVAAGNAAGAYAGSAGMEMGSIYGDTGDAGVSAVHGAVAGAFDALPIARVLNKFGIAKGAKDQIVNSVKAEVGKQAAFEGGTEALQTLVEQHAKYWVDNNGESLLSNLGEVNTKEIIDAAAAGALGGGFMGGAVGVVTKRPMDQANDQIAQAKQQAADAGGDALDQTVAAGQAQADNTPGAVTASQQPDYSAYDAPTINRRSTTEGPQQPTQSWQGIDRDILTAERMGFGEEAIRLRNAKGLYSRADRKRQSGDVDGANRDIERANAIHESILGGNAQLKQQSDFFPVPYVAQGEVMGGEIAPSAYRDQSGQTFDQPKPPEGVPYNTALLEDSSAANRLTDQGIIYGQEPSDVTAQREQRQADNFNALYGQEGQTPYAPDAVEGELDRSNELPDNRFKQLPPGTGQIDLGRDNPGRNFAPVNPVYDGVGENIAKRQARPLAALPDNRIISQAQFIDYQSTYRKSIATPMSRRSPEQKEAKAIVEAVNAGDVEVVEKLPVKPAIKKNSGLDTEKHSLGQAIAYLGGMSRQAALSLGVDPAHFKDRRGGVFGKPLFPKTGGLTEGELFESLSQEGVNYIGTQEEFRAKLFDHLSGKPHYTDDGYIRNAEIESEARARLEQPIDPPIPEATQAESWTAVAVVEARKAGVPDDTIEAILFDYADNELDIALELRHEIDRVQTEGNQAGRGAESGRRLNEEQGFPEGRPTTPEAVWGPEDNFQLNNYTEQDLAAQDEAKAKAEADTVAKQKAAQEKAQADSEVSDFTLSGSNRTADIAASRGQNDMFGASQSAKPADQASKDSIEAEIQRIGDLGKSRREADEVQAGAIPPELIQDDLAYLTAEEKTKLHELKQQLPSSTEEALAAKERNRERIEKRKSKGGSEAVTASQIEQDAQARPASNIEDFGETLEGARKHTYSFTQAIGNDVDVKAVPLSKSFPQPDYEKLAAAGTDPRVLAFVAQLRAEIKAKPRAKYKINRWAETVEAARSASASLMDGSISPERLIEKLKSSNGGSYLKHIPAIMDLAKEVMPSQIKNLGSYKIEGHHYSIFNGEKDVDKIVVTDTTKKGGFGGMGNQQFFDSVDEAKAYIKGQVTTESDTGKPMAKFDIWTERGKDGYFIGKKLSARKYIELHRTDSSNAAREYVRQHNEELVALLKKKKQVRDVRRTENNERVGKDYRSGVDVTPDLFSATFGFRGVQFGNWVENDKRQDDLNNAYDGLMDLAGLIDVPPKALSFDGQLGLAFGARGQGGLEPANAHYEPSTIIINLTKKNGAGSLAHEWFHALDNYFGRMDSPDGEGQYLTEDQRPAHKIKVVNGRQTSAKTEPADFTVRQEVYDAFKALERAINKETKLAERSAQLDSSRTKDYWSTVREMTARSFERYVIDRLKLQGFESDYLANIVSEEDHNRVNEVLGENEAYAYPLASEMDAVNRAYDNLFDIIDTKETDSGVAMFSRAGTLESLSVDHKPNTTLGDDAVRVATAGIAKRMQISGAKLNVVSTESELPSDIQDQIVEHGAKGQIKAVLHGNTIHIVADKMESVAQVEEAILHEGAHYGGQALFGNEWSHAYQKLWMKLGGVKGLQAKAKEYGINMEPYFKTAEDLLQKGEMNTAERAEFLVDEFLAHANGSKAYGKFPARIKKAIQEFIGAVRDALRKANFKDLPKLSDSDIAYLLKKINRAAQGSAESSGSPHFMRVSDADEQDIFLNNLADELEIEEKRSSFSRKDKASFSRAAPSDQFGPPAETLSSTIISKIADKFKVLKDLQKNIQDAGGSVTEESDAYLAEELFHGKAENDLRQMKDTFVEPLAKKMAELGITQTQLDEYLYAKHAAERNAHIASINPEMQDGGSGMTNAEAADVLNRVAESGKQAGFDQVASIVYDILAARRETIKANGLEDGSLIDAWESKYQYYVPLKGWAENEQQEGMPRTGKGFTIGGKESKRAMGRSSEAASPLSYAIQDLTETLIRKRKNEVGNAFLKMAEANPNDALWQVYTDDNPELSRRIKKLADGSEEVVEQAIPMAMMSDRYFTTKRDGKTYYIKLEDQRLMKAMKNIGPDTSNFLIRGLSTVNRLLSSLNTSYNPEFVVSNFARDIQTAVLNLSAEQSRDDGKINGEAIVKQTVKDVPKAMRAVYRSLRGKAAHNSEWAQWFDEFREAGAKTGYFDMKDIDGQAKELEQLISIANGGFKGGFHKWRKAGAQVVEDINNSVENAVRLSAYVNARKAGVSKAKAASLAKNMTVNFNRRGEMGVTMNALYMFANASVQGTVNFARTMYGLRGEKGDPAWSRLNTAQKMAVGLMGAAYGIAMANRMAAGDDDDGENFYDKVPQYVKERNIVIMKSLLGGDQDGTYYKIPLPYGYNIFHVFGTSAEAVTNGKTEATQAATDLALAALGSFSPIGFQDSDSATGVLLKNITPTIGKPIVDVALNENFMGSSIYSENFPFGTPKPDSALSRRSTPEAYKATAEFLNGVTGGSQWRSGAIDINPDVMRYFVNYFAGGAGAFAFSKVPDNAYRLYNGVELPEHRAIFLSRVNGKVLPYQDQSLFYDRRDEVGQILEEVKALKGRDKAEFMRDNRSKLALRGLISATEKRLKVLRKQRDYIYGQDITPKERDIRLKEVELKMKAVVDRFNNAYNQADN